MWNSVSLPYPTIWPNAMMLVQKWWLMIRACPFSLSGGQHPWNIDAVGLVWPWLLFSRLFGLKWTPAVTLVVTLAHFLFISMGISLKWAMNRLAKWLSLVSGSFFNNRASSLTFQNCSTCWRELNYNMLVNKYRVKIINCCFTCEKDLPSVCRNLPNRVKLPLAEFEKWAVLPIQTDN